MNELTVHEKRAVLSIAYKVNCSVKGGVVRLFSTKIKISNWTGSSTVTYVFQSFDSNSLKLLVLMAISVGASTNGVGVKAALGV